MWCRKVDSIAAKHVQLSKLLEASPSEVRTFVLKHPTVLQLNLISDDCAGRVQLWQQEAGRPLRGILVAPHLFQVSLKRSAARVGLMRDRGHVVSATAGELRCSPSKFLQRVGMSEAQFAIWHRKWLKTPMGLRYGS